MSDLLEIGLQAAAAGGAEILKCFHGAFDVQTKSDGSPVTDADMRANAAICSVLAATNLPILSEETAVRYEERLLWRRFWLVDPLDGTKALIAGSDEFTVNIALVEDGVPTLGIIAAPAAKMLWHARAGGGAWEIMGGVKRAIHARAPWPAAPRMVTTRFHDSPVSAEFARMNGVATCLRSGSAIKFAKVASGEVEYYPRFAGSSEWDTGAGDAILREAGAFLLSVDGEPPRYNQARTRHPYFVAWRPPQTWDKIRIPKTKPE